MNQIRKVNELYDWKILREYKSFSGEGLSYELWETCNEKYAFYLIRIGEWGQMKFCFNLQIFENKFNPKLIFDGGDKIFNYSNEEISFTHWDLINGNYLIIWQILYDGFNGQIVIINLSEKLFCTILDDYQKIELNGDFFTFYKKQFLNENDNYDFFISKELHSSELIWNSLAEFSNL